MSPRNRKQRVTLRFKRREQLKRHVRIALGRSIALALVAGFGVGLVAGHDSYLLRFLKRVTSAMRLFPQFKKLNGKLPN